MVDAAGRGDEERLREALHFNIDPNKLTGDELDMSALVAASKHGDVSAVKLLLASGADIDMATSDGTTPAIAAAEGNSVDVLKLLVAEGADLDKANEVMITTEMILLFLKYFFPVHHKFIIDIEYKLNFVVPQ